MDTVERPAQTESSMTYDGFISYSHAADDLLAPRLQAGLQRFAKPWWKRRALRIFRDESSLSANPHLWSSIVEALNDSEWFVLLLSPDAAQSEWVNQEIEHWTSYKDPTRILPVVTGGEFGWNGHGEVTGSAVPGALQGVFDEEPRWVDLRFARDAEQLDLKNPAFSNAVADIASAIRGIPKDELASEEVRQHRRTVRTAWAAGAGLLVLAVAAVGFGIQSVNNASLAEAEATRANTNSQLAQARELAASAIALLDLDPELATLLALSAVDASPSGGDLPLQVENALWRAGSTNRLVGEFSFDYVGQLSLSPDGSQLAVTTGDQELSVLDSSTGETMWTYTEETVDKFTTPAWGPSGLIALAVVDSSAAAIDDPVADGVIREDDLPNRLVVLEETSGEVVATLPIDQCDGADLPAWSPGGRHLAISNWFFPCPRPGPGGETDNWIEVFDAENWTSSALLPVEGSSIPRYDDTGALHALIPYGQVSQFEPETYEQRSIPPMTGTGDVTADGSRYFLFYSDTGLGGAPFSAYKVDSETGQSIDVIYTGSSYPATPRGVEITPDGRFVVVGTVGAFTHVYDTETGYEVFRLPISDFQSGAYDPNSERLYTTSNDGGVEVWDLRASAVGVTPTGDLGPYTWVNGSGFALGPTAGAMETIDFSNDVWAVQYFDLATGRLIGEPEPGTVGPAALESGDFAIARIFHPDRFFIDLESGQKTRVLPCEEVGENDDGDVVCQGEGEPFFHDINVSVDGSEVLSFGHEPFDVYSGHARRLDPATGAVIESFEPGEPHNYLPDTVDPLFLGAFTDKWAYSEGVLGWGVYDRASGAMLMPEPFFLNDVEPSEDGQQLAMYGGLELAIANTSDWEITAEASFTTRIRGVAFNKEGSRLAVGTEDALIVIDTSSGLIVRQLRLPGVSDAYWMDGETLLVGTNQGLFGTVSLSTDGFMADVRSGLRRTFTASECDFYRIDPCPSLEELRGG